MKLKTRVIEIEPNWLLVCFKGPKPAVDKRAFWLKRTLRDWLSDHPDRRVRRTAPIQDAGELIGVHVWLGDVPAKPKRGFAVKIHHRLIDRMPPEHLEAFLHYAYEIFFQHPGSGGALAVISRSGNTVVFDRARELCYLLPLDEVRELSKGAAEKLKEWQSQPSTNYFVMELGGFRTSE